MIRPGAVERAEHDYRDNIATYRRGELFDVLDFKRPDSICYYVRMVFDHESSGTCAVYISGDVGEGVVYPTCEANLESMAKCFTRRVNGKIDINPPYFIEKIKAASDIYDWTAEDFKSDLRRAVSDAYGDDEEMHAKIEEFIEENMDPWSPKILISDETGPVIGTDVMEDLGRILPDCSIDVYSWGRRVSVRIVLWLVALRMAWEQIEQNEGDTVK